MNCDLSESFPFILEDRYHAGIVPCKEPFLLSSLLVSNVIFLLYIWLYASYAHDFFYWCTSLSQGDILDTHNMALRCIIASIVLFIPVVKNHPPKQAKTHSIGPWDFANLSSFFGLPVNAIFLLYIRFYASYDHKFFTDAFPWVWWMS